MSHCNVGKCCGGVGGGCDCICRECFHYAYDSMDRDSEVAALKAQLAEADAKLTLATDTLVKLSLDGLIATRDTASHALLRIEAIAKARAMAKGAT